MYTNDSYSTIIHKSNKENIGFLDCILAGTTVLPSAEGKSIPAFSEGYTFGFVFSGSGTIEAQDRICNAASGSFYFVTKGERVTFIEDAAADEPWELWWIQINGTMADDLVRTFRTDGVFTDSINVRAQFLEIRSNLPLLKTENGGPALQRIACLLFEILTEVRRSEFFPAAGHTAGTADSIRSYLDNNIYSDISLDMLAEEFGITKMHIIRLFKKTYQITPIQYLMNRRINIAKNLLSGTVMPLREISEMLRYSNPQHFSNTFRNAVGMTPHEYRKSTQKV